MGEDKQGRRYLVRRSSGGTIGPLDEKAIREMARAGQLEPIDAIANVGSEKWVSVASVRGLLERPATTGGVGPITLAESEGAVAPSPPQRKHSDSPTRQVPTSGDGDSRVSRRLIVACTSVLAIITVLTVVWFVGTQRQFKLRSQVNDDLRAAVEGIENLPANTPPAEVVTRFETAQSIAHKHRDVVNESLVTRLNDVEVRAKRAKLALLHQEVQTLLRQAVGSPVAMERRRLTELARVKFGELTSAMSTAYDGGVPPAVKDDIENTSKALVSADRAASLLQATEALEAAAKAAEEAVKETNAKRLEKLKSDPVGSFRDYAECFMLRNKKHILGLKTDGTFPPATFEVADVEVKRTDSLISPVKGVISGDLSTEYHGKYHVSISFNLGTVGWEASQVSAQWSGERGFHNPDNDMAILAMKIYLEKLAKQSCD